MLARSEIEMVLAIGSLRSRCGGPTQSAASLLLDLKNAGVQVRAIVGDNVERRITPNSRGGDIEANLVDAGIEVIHASAADSLRGSSAPALRRVLDSGRAEHVVVNLQGVWEPLLWRVGLAAHSRGHAVIVTPHGMLTRWALARRRLRKEIALATVIRPLLKRTDVFRALNPVEALELRRFAGTKEIVTIPNPIPSSVAVDGHAANSGWRDELTGSWRRYILFLSRLHPGKRPDLLVRAFDEVAKALPDVALVIAGPDYGSLSAVRMAAAEMTAGRDRVFVIGEIDGPRKVEILRSAACMCLPTEHEGSSVAIIEALASGVPVITTEGACVPEVSQFGAGYIVEPTVRALADALTATLADESRRLTLSKGAMALAAAKYSPCALLEQTVRMLQIATARAERRGHR